MSVARWTWATDADARGAISTQAKTSESRATPKRSTTTRRTSSNGAARVDVRQGCISFLMKDGHAPMVHSIWPIFTWKPPFSSMIAQSAFPTSVRWFSMNASSSSSGTLGSSLT